MEIKSPEVDFNIGRIDSFSLRPDLRFEIPKGLSKKEYKSLLEETQKNIDSLLIRIREIGPENGILLDLTREDYVIKKAKLKAILKNHSEYGLLTIDKAKSYPIDQILDFKNNFIKCLWHNEKTGSLHYDRKRNKVHCFSGCGDFDSIDVYQKLHAVSLKEAVKALS